MVIKHDTELPTNNNKKKQHFLQHKEKHKNTKEIYTYGLKSIAIFEDITR